MKLQNLSPQEFEKIFAEIVDGKIAENSVKKFLLDLNEANLPVNAFIGATSVLRSRMKKISAPENAIDVCGTGGDRLGTFNISTAVCFVVASAGVPVAKHGNRAISSLSGSADIFAELGIKILSEADLAEKNLREKNLCFLLAPLFHESLKNLVSIRKSLEVPTIFNFLGPLLNPANTRLQLIGTSKKDVMKKMLATQKDVKKIYAVHGFDGMDEITLTDNSYLLRFENGKIFDEEIINPEKFGFKKVAPEALKGADPKHNAQKLIELLEGKKSAYRDIVVLNSAFALKLADKVGETADGIRLAEKMIDEGKALKTLELMRQ